MDYAQITAKCVEISKCLINKGSGFYTLDLDDTRSIGDIARFAANIRQSQELIREDQIKNRLSGRRFESYERKKLLESFYDFMSREIKLKYTQKYSVTKKEFLSQFYPHYTKHLVDLVQRICLNPKYAVSIPANIRLANIPSCINQ